MTARTPGRKPDPSLRTWAVLTEASALAAVGVLPYLLGMQGTRLDEANAKRVAAGKRPVRPALIAPLAFVQGNVTFGLVSALGLRAARSLGLGAPYLEARLYGEQARLPGSVVITSALAGAGSALAMTALDVTVFSGARKHLRRAGLREPGVWKSLLATPYGAIGEEVLMRLGLQTLIAAGLRRLRHETETPLGGATMWPAIALSNLLFGAGHLPATRQVAPLTPAVVARALTLNAVGGVTFGYLYWKRGLEAAMIAHGAADVVLHVGGSLLQRRGD